MPPALYSAAIFVTDIERAIAFYRDTLKLPLAKQGTFGAEFFAVGTRLGVHPANHPNAQAMVGRETGLVLHIPGILDYCSDLMDAGVALVADPDGNRIALWEELEDTKP